ncbi:glycosyltransferase [Halocynthiibacter styelae]|uniref:Glycosyltransferase n=1 Tax=Halocynthiibacter styelae TaxID=2761955 RepID=A0A8J7IZ94_9RHOB|nr:glycosyltransferase [Paenihalocynthiibacter styelae]MBI1495085.1 glycosyltransferase [Paenihalocynthiibacter styelae]
MSTANSAFDIMRLQEQQQLDHYIRPKGADYIRELGKIEVAPLRKLLRKTGFIDAAWYSTQVTTPLSPDEHYAKTGIYEGLSPNPWFDPQWYAGRYADDIAGEPTAWFIQHGWKRFHDPSRSFSTWGYLHNYPDVAQARINPLLHFLRAPAGEHRKATPAISPLSAKAGIWPSLRAFVPPAGSIADRIQALNSHDIGVDITFLHDWGGGIDTRFRDSVKRRLTQNIVSLAIRSIRNGRVALELWADENPLPLPDVAQEELPDLLDHIQNRYFVYASAVANDNAHETPGFILRCAARDNDPLEVRIHDYFPLSPSYTLQDSDGVFRGIPASDTSDSAHTYMSKGGTAVPLSAWRENWKKLMERANKIVIESASVSRTLTSVWSGFSEKLVMHPQEALPYILPVLPPLAGRLNIGILGNMVPHKGAGIVQALASVLPADATLTVLGDLDPEYTVPAQCQIHGRYMPQDISLLATHYGINCWLIPSIWPETFCFTAHEALQTDLPVFSFDYGAQADTMRSAVNGHVLTELPDKDTEQPARILDEIQKTVKATLNQIQISQGLIPEKLNGLN